MRGEIYKRSLLNSVNTITPFNRRLATMSNSFVKRTTLFKVPEEHIDLVLKQYEVLRSTAVKDGKPYIVSNVARRITNTSSPLSEGYTISSQSIFKNVADHAFYDKECPAHMELKVGGLSIS